MTKNTGDVRRKRKGNPLVWVVLGLLVLALGGFGIGSFGGDVRTIASVGAVEVDVDAYGRALQQEQQRLSQATGEPMTMARMRQFGLDRRVVEDLLTVAALDAEADALGLDAGDGTVAARVREIAAFRGVDGSFDREAYAFALRSAGLDERTFEEQLRDEAARQVLQSAITGGAGAPPGYAETLASFLSQTRDLTFAEVPSDGPNGIEPPGDPSDDELETLYDGDPERFRRPERRVVTAAFATVEEVATADALDEADLRSAYEARADVYQVPERVLAERLAFADADAAVAARDAIEAGETTFDALVEERGLTLEDVDQGEVSTDDVEPAVAEALFALDEPGLAGPVETALGPALYRVNAILNALVTPFDEARDEIAATLSAEAARRRLDEARDDIDDLLAGGATLEEIAEETVLTLHTETVSADSPSEGALADPAVREVIASAEPGDFPELLDLADGGLAALRVDRIEPAAVPPLDAIRDEVAAAWRADAQRDALQDRAAQFAARIEAGETFEAVELDPRTVTGVAREDDAVPPALLDAALRSEAGTTTTVDDGGRTYVVRIDAVHDADPEAPETTALIEAIRSQAQGEVANDLLTAYGAAIRDDVGFTINEAAVQAVQTQLLGP